MRPTIILLALMIATADAQLATITSGQVLPDAITENFNALSDGPISGMHAAFTAMNLGNVSLFGTFTVSGDDLDSPPGNSALCSRSNVLTIAASTTMIDNSGSSGGNGWRFELAAGVTATQLGFKIVDEGFGSPLAVVRVFSGGMLRGSIGVANPSTTTDHLFESSVPFDMFEIGASSFAGGWAVDDLMIAGFSGPSCMINAPAPGAMFTGNVPVNYDVDAIGGSMVDVSFEYSTDAGATWSLCTPVTGVNPELGVTTPSAGRVFEWDTVADAVGVAAPQSADLRLTVAVGASSAVCLVGALAIDNSALCNGICGDCNENLSGPDVLDALVAAQIAAVLIVPTPSQIGCCDVNSSMTVTILDALGIAQFAAGLAFTPMCP